MKPTQSSRMFRGGERGEARPFSNDWQWQVKHRIINRRALSRLIPLSRDEWEAAGRDEGPSLALTPYLAGLIDPGDRDCPFRKQFIPAAAELRPETRPLPRYGDEMRGMVFPWLFHRQPRRARLRLSGECFAHCRFCAWRHWGEGREGALTPGRLALTTDYLRRHPEVGEVIVSGGDPLFLPDPDLETALGALRRLPAIEVLRIETRAPVTLPCRVTPALVSLLKRLQPLWIVIQINHPREITPEAQASLDALADGGIPLGSQTVLLRGINDRPQTMHQLFQRLVSLRVRPQYLLQCRPAPGNEHFQTTIQDGLRIMEFLRSNTSGLGIPAYVIDLPGGGGKVPLGPNYILNFDSEKVLIRNSENLLFEFFQPPAEWMDPSPIAT